MKHLIRVCIALLLLLPGVTPAHEVRPALLLIQQQASHHYDLMWKVPTRGDTRLNLNVVLPPNCQTQGAISNMAVDDALIQRWTSSCADGLRGNRIRIQNLPQSLTDVVVHYASISGKTHTYRLTGEQAEIHINDGSANIYTASAYFGLGIEHILMGYDHVLFVILLTLIAASIRSLLWAVSVFTLAHSMTLIATTLNWVALPVGPVEACIALSVVLLAVKACQPRIDSTQLTRWLIVTCVCFGLLHGFGFAAALVEIGLPTQSRPAALFLFNLGVEIGQLAVVSIIVVLRMLYVHVFNAVDNRHRLVVPYFVGGLACFWFFDRVHSLILN